METATFTFNYKIRDNTTPLQITLPMDGPLVCTSSWQSQKSDNHRWYTSDEFLAVCRMQLTALERLTDEYQPQTTHEKVIALPPDTPCSPIVAKDGDTDNPILNLHIGSLVAAIMEFAGHDINVTPRILNLYTDCFLQLLVADGYPRENLPQLRQPIVNALQTIWEKE